MTAILVTGSRDWIDTECIIHHLKRYEEERPVLIHGECRGCDELSGCVAEILGFEIVTFKPDWKKFGKAAGPIRNKAMVDYLVKMRDQGSKCIVLAFHPCIERSRGTKNCVMLARKAGFEVEVITGQ